MPKEIWKMNDCYIDLQEPLQLFSTIVTSISDFQFYSPSALQQLYSETTQLVLEVMEIEREGINGTRRGALTRQINVLKNRAKRPLPNTQNRMLKLMYDTVLASEGLGLLPRFGFGNKFGDQLPGNPEWETVKKVEKQASQPPNTWKERKEKEMKEDVKRSELVNVARELNEVLGLDPEIDVKAKPEELKEKLKEAAALLLEEDEISDKTRDILNAINLEKKPKKVKEVLPGAPEETENVVEGKEETFSATTSFLLDQVEDAKKLDELKALVEENVEFKSLRKTLDRYKGLQGPRALKAHMMELLEDAVPEKAEKEKANNKTKKTMPSGQSQTTQAVNFLAGLIKKGKYTRAQLLEEAKEEFPELKKSTVATILSDGKNPKYTRFGTTYKEDEKGKTSF